MCENLKKAQSLYIIVWKCTIEQVNKRLFIKYELRELNKTDIKLVAFTKSHSVLLCVNVDLFPDRCVVVCI